MNFEKLYQKYYILMDAKAEISEHIQDYAESIEGTRGGEKEKKLSTQILSKYFKHFPSLQTKALNAILDLCEDEDSVIRICAMKVLPLMCKDSQEHLDRIVYVLAQLLIQLEDQEHNVASNAIKMIYKDFPQEVVKALFLFIQKCTDVTSREKTISFILKTLLTTPVNGNKGEIEDAVIEELKKLLTFQNNLTMISLILAYFQFGNPEEFIIIMPYLTSSKYGKTLTGANQLLDTIAEQMELDQDFDPLEQGSIEKLITCLKYALPIFSPKIESNKFVMYICDHVLSQWDALKNVEKGDLIQLQILRFLAELSIYCGKLENPSSHVVHIFSLLKTYMPLQSDNEDELPELDFTSVECLLFTFHRLARQCPDFLTHDPEVLNDFRSRLFFFSRGVQGCSKVLNNTLNHRTKIRTEDQDKMKIAPSLLENIKALVKDLFYKPPIYKVSVTLSFLNKTIAVVEPKTEKAESNPKRHAPITFESDSSTRGSKQFKPIRGENMKLYQPPSGKFSNNSSFQSYDRSGRGRGGYRGRGRGLNRNWRN